MSVAEETEEDQSNEDPEPSNLVAENETELESDDYTSFRYRR